MSQSQPPSQFRFRYGIGTILLVMVVVSVAAAAASYMVQSIDSPGWQRLVFILITLAAPVVLLVIVSIFHLVTQWLSKR